MRRQIGPLVLLTGCLVAFGGFAWLTRHPDSELLRKAREWPVVGPLATAFQQLYLTAGNRQTEGAETDGYEVELVMLPPDGEGTAELPESSPGPMASAWVPAGAPLRSAPRADSVVVSRVESISRLEVWERRGDWRRVRHGDREGWIRLETSPDGSGPPLGSDPEPVLPLPGLAPDPTLLARGRRLMRQPHAVADLGPYTLYTDNVDAGLLDYCDQLAEQVEEVYRRRYGLDLVGDAAEAVLLFRREPGYREFHALDDRLAGLHPSGHSSKGIVALYVGARSRWEVGSTLIHELTHLLNRRALGPALPPWLDEGLAEDLAWAEVDSLNRLHPERLGGESTQTGNLLVRRGPAAAAPELERALASGRAGELEHLVAMDWEEFVRPADRRLHYAQSAFWVRYLLDGPDPALGEAFRAFLVGVSRGARLEADSLRSGLGPAWPELEAGFRRWFDGEVVAVLQRRVEEQTAKEG